MTVTRRQTLALAGAGAMACAAPPLFAAPRRQYGLVPVEVADGLWMIEGTTEYFSDENGGAIVNCALARTDTGIVVIDTGPSRKYGEALRAAANEISALGVAAAINTHHHPDHFFGNQVFADRPIHALPRTSTLARDEGEAFSDNMYRLLGDWMLGTEVVPPDTAIDSSVLTIGGRAFTVLPLSGHTDADLALVDQATGTLIAGDLAFLDRAPTTPHADLALWRQSLEALQAVGASAVLPGHGPFDSAGQSLRQTDDYLDWLGTTLTDAAKEGLDMVEIMALPLPGRFAAMGAMPTEFHRSVSHLFADIERQALPLVK